MRKVSSTRFCHCCWFEVKADVDHLPSLLDSQLGFTQFQLAPLWLTPTPHPKLLKESNFLVTLSFSKEKAMATRSSVLAWRVPGKEEPGGLPPMGSHRVGHD